MVFHPVFHRSHAHMFLEVFAEERRIGEVQVVGYLLYRHVCEAQPMLYGHQREVLYNEARPAVHHLLHDHRQILGRYVHLAGKLVHPADAAVALFHDIDKLVHQKLLLSTSDDTTGSFTFLL